MVGPAGPGRQFRGGMMGSSQRRGPSWLGWSRTADLRGWARGGGGGAGGGGGGGGGGGARRGRCKYVPVSSVAASMRLTPLRSLPARPLTVSCACQPRKRIKRSKAKAGSLCRAEPMLGCCTRSLSAEHGSALQKIIPIILSFIHAWRGSTVSTKVDTHQCNIPFRQIAGSCRRRGGFGCGGVRGMDAAAKPPGTGLRRPPQPDPPRHPQETRFCSGSGS